MCISWLTLHYTLKKMPFEKTEGKGENAGYQHFLLFPQCFLPFFKTNFNISGTFIVLSANAFNLDQSKICSFGKELTLSQTSPGVCVSAVQVF